MARDETLAPTGSSPLRLGAYAASPLRSSVMLRVLVVKLCGPKTSYPARDTGAGLSGVISDMNPSSQVDLTERASTSGAMRASSLSLYAL